MPSPAPLLDIRKLTMRFGGLTAVDNVDLQIRAGQVFSVIGPNGAGKTTVFNAVTGIYEPTSGTIAFNGQPLGRPATWKLWLTAALIGTCTALVAAVCSNNVDGLWGATIVRNFDFEANQFHFAEAGHDFWGYLSGQLEVISLPQDRWTVAKPDGTPLLGVGPGAARPTLEAANQLRDAVHQLVDSGKPIAPVSRAERWAILSADEKTVLVDFARQETAERTAAALAAVRGGQTERIRTSWIALFAGLAMGIAGTLVVRNRARRTPDVIALAGIARTFQNIRLFANMTVLENVLIGLDRAQSTNVLRMMLRTPGVRREEATMRKRAIEALCFVGLESSANALANSLAYGDQRRLEIARALATSPQLLLLDEPAAGMNPAETVELMTLVRRIRQRGITVLLIEHHMNVVMGISDIVAVLDYGEKIAEGPPDAVRRDPKVIEAYLGKDAD